MKTTKTKNKRRAGTKPVEGGADTARGSGLSWIPIDDFFLIPPYLFEQIEGRDYEVNRLYELAPQIRQSPDCILGVFVDSAHKIKGFMWCGVNPLSRRLTVHALSVDPVYQRRGIVGEAYRILKKMVRDMGLTGFVFYTMTPEKFKTVGASATGMIQMEV